jgi:hypothetical protein
MRTNDIIKILTDKGHSVKKQTEYNGSECIQRYSILESSIVDSITSYGHIPYKIHSQGFISKNKNLRNFYYHDGKVFKYTKDFISNIMEDLFNLEHDEIQPLFIDKEEYFEITQQLFNTFSMTYAKSHHRQLLNDSDYPSEEICNSCKGCGVFKLNDEYTECYQNYEYGECYYIFFDSEEFHYEIQNEIEEIHMLLGYNGIN